MRVLKILNRKFEVLSVCDCENGADKLTLFLASLDGNFKANKEGILQLIEYAATNAPLRNNDLSHQIDKEEGVWEFIKGRLRVPYFYDKGKVIVVAGGFLKKSQKTPTSVIAHAIKIKKEYEAAKEAGNLTIEDATDE